MVWEPAICDLNLSIEEKGSGHLLYEYSDQHGEERVVKYGYVAYKHANYLESRCYPQNSGKLKLSKGPDRNHSEGGRA